MGRFKKFFAAFMLAVFMGTVVYAPKAQAGVITEGAIAAEVASIVTSLGTLLSTVGEMSAEVKKVSTSVSAIIRFIQTGVYSVRSLAIIEYYGRTVSQFVSNVATGKFYNFSSAIYAANNALISFRFVIDIFNDTKDFLVKGSETTDKSNSVRQMYDRLVSSYKEMVDSFDTVKQENNFRSMLLFQDAMYYSMAENEQRMNKALNQFQAMEPEYLKGMTVGDVININFLNPNA